MFQQFEIHFVSMQMEAGGGRGEGGGGEGTLESPSLVLKCGKIPSIFIGTKSTFCHTVIIYDLQAKKKFLQVQKPVLIWNLYKE